MTIRRNFTFIAVVSVLAAAAMLLAGCVFLPKKEAFTLTVCVKDGFSGKAVSGAAVVIPETGDRLITDSEGFTPEASVPFIADEHYSRLQRQDSGIATVLIYRDGYVPYALFYLRTHAGERRTVTLYIFPDDGTMREPFSVIESPDDAWISDFTEKFRPKA